jgi:hypothetical protein
VFIMHGTTSIVPPFGQYAYYEEEAGKKWIMLQPMTES